MFISLQVSHPYSSMVYYFEKIRYIIKFDRLKKNWKIGFSATPSHSPQNKSCHYTTTIWHEGQLSLECSLFVSFFKQRYEEYHPLGFVFFLFLYTRWDEPSFSDWRLSHSHESGISNCWPVRWPWLFKWMSKSNYVFHPRKLIIKEEETT